MSKKETIFVSPGLLEGPDPLMQKFASWQMTDNGVKFTDTTPTVSDIEITDISPWRDAGPHVTADGTAMGYDKQIITIVQKAEEGSVSHQAYEEWTDKLSGLIAVTTPLTYYEHYVTSLDNPLITEEVLNLDVDVLGTTAGVEYEYNYFDKKYENVLETVSNHEIIPSMYSRLNENMKLGADVRTYFGPPDLVGGAEIVDIDTLRGPTARELRRNKRRPNKRRKFINQIVPIENTALLDDYNGNRYLFPMFVNINIPLDRNNEVAQIMADTGLGAILMRDVNEQGRDVGIWGAPIFQQTGIDFSTSYIDNTTGLRDTVLETITVKNVDIMDWWNYSIGAYGYERPLPDDATFVGPEPYHSSSRLATEGHGIHLATQTAAFFDQIKELAADKLKNFEDLKDGDSNYSETLMYKIEKYLGPNPGNSTPIQTFHVMNRGDVESVEQKTLSFCDTQVKYGEEYSYVVSAYQIVFGTKYRYSNLRTFKPGWADEGDFYQQLWAKVDVFSEPLIKLVEVPLFMSTGKIIDNPPLEPEIRFIPQIGFPNRLKVFFTTSTGQIDLEPVTLSRKEARDANQITLNQKRTDGKITFKTDDYASGFRIYRLREPPVTIEDFAGKVLSRVSTTPGSSKTNLQAGSATAVIRQPPNQKFYYMFRTLDFHGNISNPSPVYEIELYNDGGVGYPIIRQYEFNSIDPKTTTKPARKIIQILPRISQVFLNEEKSGLVDEDGILQAALGRRNIILGNEDTALFGKRFKVRLTSKSTGKKLDINLDFKTKRVRGPIE
jgi:hypothetical protein